MGKTEERSWRGDRTSKIAKRPIRSYDLIICCGMRTEPNYFNKATDWIKSEYKIKDNIAKFFIIKEDCVDPLSMAKNAPNIKTSTEKSENITIDMVWVIFDKDDFKDDAFNNAINSLNSKDGYKALWSNQCFELWLLLHFELLDSAITRQEYIKKLSKFLPPKYEKNDPLIFNNIMLHGSLPNAKKYAKKLFDKSKTPANNEPATTIFQFFDYYDKYLGVFSNSKDN